MNHRNFAALAALLAVLGIVAGGALAQATAPAGESLMLMDMETCKHKPTEITVKEGTEEKKIPVGTVESVEGKVGKACQFAFIEAKTPGFFTAWVNPFEKADDYEGISFWVKGDGSGNFGGIELIDGKDYKLRYGIMFPLASKEWVKVTVPWRDVIPELNGKLVDAKTGYAPSNFRNLWVGRWVQWRQYPAITFAIDNVQLEKKIDADKTDYTPKEAGAPRVLAKLKDKKPITVVTMGDSLSDKKHWANQKKLWSEELVKDLKTKYGSEAKLVNPALGGTTLTQNVMLMPKWLKDTPQPDLVTICFGFNDWDSGVRGEQFKEYVRMAVDRVRRETKGSADIILLTTMPALKRWDTMKEMEDAVREVAKEKKTGLGDLATEVRKLGTADETVKLNVWGWDNVHLGAKGHDIVKEVVLKVIEESGK